jgi:hypothetical protein
MYKRAMKHEVDTIAACVGVCDAYRRLFCQTLPLLSEWYHVAAIGLGRIGRFGNARKQEMLYRYIWHRTGKRL